MKKLLSSIKWQTYVLLLLMILGIFLRTYDFHSWLLFGDDQIRDAYITNDVVTGKSPLPLTGPFMSFSGDGSHSEADSFHLGPIYYYFQMFSAKIFGNYPDRLAYPDVFFSILSIPLFYAFLRIFFSENLALGLVGLYSISAYFISYSRFAWNTNLIPFFVLLFLFSIYKFLEKKEKTSWIWVLSLGFALGVGFQLHAIVMILFSSVTFLVFLFSLRQNPLVWKKWAVVFLIFMALNTSQMISEARTNFSNTKNLLSFAFPGSASAASTRPNTINMPKLERDLDCHVEANALFLSSNGDGQCTHVFMTAPADGLANRYFSNSAGKTLFATLLASLLFSIFGYFFLIYHSWKEPDAAKKYFLRFIVIYFAIGFLIMLPLSQNGINDLRYFVFGFFMPFLFLGFLIKFISQKFLRMRYLILPVAIIFSLLIISNVEAIISDAKPFLADNVSCSTLYQTTLGELEPIVQYIVSNSTGRKQVYLGQNDSQRIMFDSLTYLLRQQGMLPIQIAPHFMSAANCQEPCRKIRLWM